MPNATVNVGETEQFDLKSLEGAYVILKRYTYGQSVERRAMMKLSLEMGGRGSKNKDFKGEMAMASKEIQMFEFKSAIVDHNLEDVTGRKLNLATPVDFDSLAPQVGQEIESLIRDMNEFDEDDQGN